MGWESWLLPPIFLIVMSYLPSLQSFFAQTFGWGRGASTTSSSSSISSTKTSASGATSDSQDVKSHIYEPTPMDILVVKMMLQQGLNLPAEVVLSILDFAEYWPHTSATLDSSFVTNSGRDTENRFVVRPASLPEESISSFYLLTDSQLRTKPLGLIKKTQEDEHSYTFTRVPPKALSDGGEYSLSQFQTWIGGPTDTIEHPCRKIVFTITSHDQGWSNTARHDRGSYRGSYTWFEAGLERFDRKFDSEDTSDEKVAGAVPVQRSAFNEEAPTEATAGETSEAANFHEKTFDDNGESSSDNNERGDCMPDSYPSVDALRPIYPILQAEADPPAHHFELLPSPQYTIQHNKTATRTPTTHTIVWSCKDNINPPTAQHLKDVGRGEQTGTGEFVRNLKLGDVVTVWAKSRFGGWANHVDAVKVDVYWAL